MALMAVAKKKKKKAVGNGGGKGSLNQAARAINIDEKEWERWRARVERKNEKETVKILGIWGFLFVFIIDCIVVNFLD